MAKLFRVALAFAAAGFVSAQHDNTAHLDKPTLVDNLDYLEPGLVANLPSTAYTASQWAAGWIPEECKFIAQGNIFSDLVYNPADFQIYDIRYSDCGDPWVFCHHKNSNVTINSMASQFGRLPVQMRQFIRHVVDVPSDSGFAFEYDATITFIRPIDDMLTAIVHETGHSLDFGAYADNSLSASDNWWNNYDQDTNVPDGYAQSNAIEDVAQNTVVAVYNENVAGGYGSIEPNWIKIFHQYATIITEARNAGHGNSILVPGQNQQCSHRYPSSKPVPADDSSRKGRSDRSRWSRGPKPDVSLKSGVKVLRIPQKARKPTNCTLSW